MTVFVILTTGAADYYDSAEFHSVYSTREAAEAKAAELRTKTYGDWTDELEYEGVEVIEQEVLG